MKGLLIIIILVPLTMDLDFVFRATLEAVPLSGQKMSHHSEAESTWIQV